LESEERRKIDRKKKKLEEIMTNISPNSFFFNQLVDASNSSVPK
jgi:hypothetical protein